MMRRGGGKAKGSAFEREVCKLLSLWVSDGKDEDLFWRSAMSGGRSTVAHKKGRVVRQSGDITAVAPAGHALTDHWHIECKAYRDIRLGQFIVKNTGPMAEWWKTACKQAALWEKKPALIVKQNGWPTLFIASSILPVRAMPVPLFTMRWGRSVYLFTGVLNCTFSRRAS